MHDRLIIERLRSLGLSGMADGYYNQSISPTFMEMPFPDRFSHLLHAEEEIRTNRRRERLLKSAKMRVNSLPEELIFDTQRGLDRSLISELLLNQWLSNKHNVLVDGPTGTGKTFLICALGHQATRDGFSVRYFNVNPLLEHIGFCRLDHTIAKFQAALAKVDLLILDDFGVSSLDEQARHDLFNILEYRTGLRSTIVAGQRPIKEWYAYIGHHHLSDAIMDRLFHRAHRLSLKGESLRERL